MGEAKRKAAAAIAARLTTNAFLPPSPAAFAAGEALTAASLLGLARDMRGALVPGMVRIACGRVAYRRLLAEMPAATVRTGDGEPMLWRSTFGLWLELNPAVPDHHAVGLDAGGEIVAIFGPEAGA